MPTLRDIKRRIRSVQDTGQITKAMKMIAGARLRRAQERMLAMRPYCRELARILSGLLPQLDGTEHTLLERREPVRRVGLVYVTPDRGLCGGLPGGLLRTALGFLDEHLAAGREVTVYVSGRKGRRALAPRAARDEAVELAFSEEGDSERPPAALAERLAASLAEGFEQGRIDAGYVVYAEFRSAAAQKVVTRPLLPVTRESLTHEAPVSGSQGAGDGGRPGSPYVAAEIEPGPAALAEAAIRRHLGAAVYKALLEGAASELGARLTAMDAATRNATDLIAELTLAYNKARQAAITKEILDIVGGVEALS